GVAIEERDTSRASVLSEESLAVFQDLGDIRGIAWSLGQLGLVAKHQGGLQGAAALIRESVRLSEELGTGRSWWLFNLGAVTRELGDHARALDMLEDSLRRAQDMGDRRGVMLCIEELARLTFA